MLNREFPLRGPESLLTCHSAWRSSCSPGSSGWSFIPSEWRKDAGISVHPSIQVKSLWFPSICSMPREVSALTSPRSILQDRLWGEKLVQQSRNVRINLYSSWNYSSCGVPRTDRGNMSERIDVRPSRWRAAGLQRARNGFQLVQTFLRNRNHLSAWFKAKRCVQFSKLTKLSREEEILHVWSDF